MPWWPSMKTTMFSTLALLLMTAMISKGAVAVSQTVSRTKIVAGETQEVVVRITVTGQEQPAQADDERPSMNLGLVLDRSGSMSGLRIEQAREAARMAVRQMTSKDFLSLVSFGQDVTVDVPATLVTASVAFESAIAEMQAAGFTPLYEGVETGAAEIKKNLDDKHINRVLLMSDGHANRGPSTPAELAALGSKLAAAGVSVTTIGLGDQFNEDLMTSLAASSDANYYYVSDVEELPGVFEKELGALKDSVAREIRIHIECPPGVTPVEVIGRPNSADGHKAEVGLGLLQAGQERSIYVRCRIDAEKLTAGSGNQALVTTRTVYRPASGERAVTVDSEPVAVEVTTSGPEAEQSINAEVTAEVALLEAAETRNQAIQLNDAGGFGDADAALRGKAAELDSLAEKVTVPAAREQLSREAARMRSEADQAGAGALAPSDRKNLQGRAWQQLNSKEDLIEKQED